MFGFKSWIKQQKANAVTSPPGPANNWNNFAVMGNPGYDATHFIRQPDSVLTSGSDLDVAAEGSNPYSWTDSRGARGGQVTWPNQIESGFAIRMSYRPNSLRQISTHNVPSNYGGVGSMSDYRRRGWEFGRYPDRIGEYPGPVPAANRPTYNNLTPIVWGLRVIDPNSQAQMAELTQVQVTPVAPATFTPAGNAQLRETVL